MKNLIRTLTIGQVLLWIIVGGIAIIIHILNLDLTLDDKKAVMGFFITGEICAIFGPLLFTLDYYD